MGDIFASCRHKIDDIDKALCMWEEYDEGHWCLVVGTLCEECKELYSLVKDQKRWKEKHKNV